MTMTTLFAGATPLILFIVKATLVLVAALGAATALRRGTAGSRHLVWLAALVGVLALPVLARIPSLRLAVLPAGTLGDAPARIDAALPPAPLVYSSANDRIASESRQTPKPGVSTAPSAQPPELGSPVPTLLVVWGGVALSLLVWLVAGAIKVRRIVVNGRELTSSDWTVPLCEVADRLDLEAPPRLVLSDEIEMAFACRATLPTIVLPKTAESWSDDRRRAVLFHELAHVKRHDLLGHTLGRVACALYWFHPLVWTAAKKLRAESERACDDLVLSCGARPSEYAQHLLDMVTNVRRHGAPVMAMPMARPKEFEGRMLAILDPAIRRKAPGRVQAALVVSTLGVMSLTIAAVAPAPAKAPLVAPSTVAAKDSPVTVIREMAKDARPDSNPGRPVATAEREVEHTVEHMVEQKSTTQTLSVAVSKFAGQVSTAAANAVASAFSGRTTRVDTARVGLLIKVLETDADPSVRRSAAWALHDVPTTGARSALEAALGHDADDRVREMAAWSLAELDSEDSDRALADALLKDKSPIVRTTAAWALGRLDRSGAADALTSAVSDPEASVRESAIWALGQHDLRGRAPATLFNALTDPSSRVRMIAAWTLGQIEDTAAVRPLAHAFETETDDHVRTAQLWALSAIGVAPTSVIDAAMKSSDPELRRRAVGMLAGSGGPWPWPWPRPQPRVSP